MGNSKKLFDLFPTENEIPAEYNITTPLNIREYLLNGKMVHWDGAMQEVTSPIFIREGSELKKKVQ